MQDADLGIVVRRTLVILLMIGLAMLVYALSDVFLLIFAAVLLGVIIRAAGDPFRMVGVPETLAVLLGVVILVAVLGLSGWLFGSTLVDQFSIISAQLPSGIAAVRNWLSTQPFGQSVLSATPDLQAVAGRAVTFAFGAVGAIANFLLVLIGAIYLAMQPATYLNGVKLLFPKSQGERVEGALVASGTALRNYLLGQLVTMAAVGTMVGVGLALIGMPSAAALGLIVGLANFIPLIGPIIGAVPGLLLGLTQGPETALWTAIIYLVAQQLEGNVLTPIVQRQAVSIPPAVLIFAITGLGMLFGSVGVILAAPMAVVLFTLVRRLWIRETLGHEEG